MIGKKEGLSSPMETVIGAGTRFQGNIRSKGFVRVDGVVEGGLCAEGVIVGEKADVTGDVIAKMVFIAGKVTGNVTAAHSLEIQPKGQVRGDLRTAQVSIADGAFFEGHCLMNAEKIGALDVEKALSQTTAPSIS
ncbi:MAG: polymer-forming cytoskeletal protein [Elusimicrobia bacterium]|nr:polymer-forming cytoskeletal protein [Elusimicrobiota bacterium]MBP9127414.1 polymer-forming cytoskeletal protein [Elusimicrobiota bacterium]MBP9698379.1 polymer-forming cytoskeletal protein [Elusimicrobiota bacterium]